MTSPAIERLRSLPWVTELQVRRPCEAIRWSRVPVDATVIPASATCHNRARFRYEVLPESVTTDAVRTGHYCTSHAQVVAFGGNVERARIEKLERQRAAAAHARAARRRNKIAAVPGEGTPISPTAPEPEAAAATA